MYGLKQTLVTRETLVRDSSEESPLTNVVASRVGGFPVSNLLCIALPDGRWLALDRETFAAALIACGAGDGGGQ